MNAAEDITKILARISGDVVEQLQRLCPVGHHRGARLHDRNIIAAKASGGAHRSRDVLRTDALVHARPMILARHDVVEYIKRACLRDFRQFIRAPGLANLAFGSVSISRSNQRASKCKPAERTRRLTIYKSEHGRRICLLLPEM